MKTLLCLVLVVGGAFLVGCSSSGSDLSKDDKVKMDKLFREGVKPPNAAAPAPGSKTPGPRGSPGTPLNAADK